MIGEFSNIKIQGMASAVPEYIEENTNFTNILGQRRTKKQIKLTGVSKRHISGKHQRTSDLCYAAAGPLMKKLNWRSDEIKVLIYITQGPNYILPSTAFFLQHRLGIPKDCVCFDINLGCSSFNVGVHVVSALLQSCNISDKALLLIGDTASKVLDPEEPMTEEAISGRMIFGAAGAAIALEKVEQSNLKFMTKSDGDGFEAIIRQYGLGTTMDGTAVFEFAINDVSDDVAIFKEHFSLKEDDIDYYIFHQAQKLILDNIAANCHFPEGKELRSLEEYGNTSGTSVPLTVCSNLDKFADKKNIKLFLCGFGVGLSWGTIFTEVPTENILPVIETDEHYDDDKIPAGRLTEQNILVLGADKAMGKTISWYIARNGATVFLSGTDEDGLNDVQENLFWESHIIAHHRSDESGLDAVSQFFQEKNICLDGIVFADGDMSFDMIQRFCLKLQKEEILQTESCSIVLVSNASISDKTFSDQKEDLETSLAKLQEAVKCENTRINAVLYDEAKLELTPFIGSDQEWIEKYLQKNCSSEMDRPLFIAKTLVYLLSKDSQYTTGLMIPINK